MDNDYHHLRTLFEAIALIETNEEAEKFITDLCTPQEIKSLSERWKVCQLLNNEDLSYRQINQITGASTTTICRIARFLNTEPYKGYKNLLEKIRKENENVEKNNGDRGNFM